MPYRCHKKAMPILFAFYHLLCLRLSFVDGYAVAITSLPGHSWTATSNVTVNGSTTKISVNATVPGNIYTDLFKAGIIDDPYLEENDVKYRWVAESDWSYEITFGLPDYGGDNDLPLVLVLKGVDTICSIYINGFPIGSTTSMFREYFFPFPAAPGHVYKLKAVFISPINYAANQYALYGKSKGYDVPPVCPPTVQNGACHANFVRKMQSSFSWDWGPAFPGVGFYKDVFLQVAESCFVDSVSGVPVRAMNSEDWLIQGELFLYCLRPAPGIAMLSIPELNVTDSWTFDASELKVGMNTLRKVLRVRRKYVFEAVPVWLWWPSGYGAQKLYDFVGKVKLEISNTAEVVKLCKIAFRTVQLVQEPVFTGNISRGLTFYFKINDIPIFLKGTNWIPADSFQTRITEEKLGFLFHSIVEANMNALRVWGGGVYESDRFYELADQHGLLVWQDMMFAVALYPADSQFLENVQGEIKDQIRRLKRHPSIIVWAGNNENELGLRGGWYHAPHMAGTKQYERDYMDLYNETIWKVVNETDFYSRPFLLSSPSNGMDTIKEGGLALRPGDPNYGDLHVYDYSRDAWIDSTFPIGRCITEYGYQSMPSARTLLSAIPNSSEWSYFSSSFLHRQHHALGNAEMMAQAFMHFSIPGCEWSLNEGKPLGSSFLYNGVKSFAEVCSKPLIKGSRKGEHNFVEDMIYLSQAHQAVAYQVETEHYRRWRNQTDLRTGQGQTMCALYWQLNDIWQAPTWATVDWGLKWKMAHYFARRFFSSVIVSPYLSGDRVKISVVSDLREEIRNATLIIDLFAWSSGLRPVYRARKLVPTIPALTAVTVYSETRVALRSQVAAISGIQLSDITPEDFMLRARLRASDGSLLAPENVWVPSALYKVPPTLFGKVTVEGVRYSGVRQVTVQLKSTGIAPFVWLDSGNVQGWFEDNGFTMTEQRKNVQFFAWSNEFSVKEFDAIVSVKSLRDLYVNEL